MKKQICLYKNTLFPEIDVQKNYIFITRYDQYNVPIYFHTLKNMELDNFFNSKYIPKPKDNSDIKEIVKDTFLDFRHYRSTVILDSREHNYIYLQFIINLIFYLKNILYKNTKLFKRIDLFAYLEFENFGKKYCFDTYKDLTTVCLLHPDLFIKIYDKLNKFNESNADYIISNIISLCDHAQYDLIKVINGNESMLYYKEKFCSNERELKKNICEKIEQNDIPEETLYLLYDLIINYKMQEQQEEFSIFVE